ncbi:MAG: hypothetical protein ACXWQO_02960 [Bdellovibrionota bacterium]
MKYLNKISPFLFILLPALMLAYGLSAHAADDDHCEKVITGHDFWQGNTYQVYCDGMRASPSDLNQEQAIKIQENEEMHADRDAEYEKSDEYKQLMIKQAEEQAKDDAKALVHPPISY